jgi:hypothetical protein
MFLNFGGKNTPATKSPKHEKALKKGKSVELL